MALPAKERISQKGLSQPVTLNDRFEPDHLSFKAPSWQIARELDVKGKSNSNDLALPEVAMGDLATIFSAAQYILFDEDMNPYEAYIIVRNRPSMSATMTAIRSIPHK